MAIYGHGDRTRGRGDEKVNETKGHILPVFIFIALLGLVLIALSFFMQISLISIIIGVTGLILYTVGAIPLALIWVGSDLGYCEFDNEDPLIKLFRYWDRRHGEGEE